MQKINAISVTIILSILLTACAAANPASSASTTLNVDMSEFMFTPGSYTVLAGKEITVELKNSGSVDHDFIILKKGIEVNGSFNEEKYANDIIARSKLGPGETGKLTFTAPTEAGQYQIICGILGHFQAGMIGSLTVVAP